MTEPIKEKLRKVYALALRGTDGEKEVAKRLLTDLLKKHKLTLADIETEERTYIEFSYQHTMERDLLVQIGARVLDSDTVSFRVDKKKRRLYIRLTRVEAIDMEMLYSTFRVALMDELDRFLVGFYAKHQLCNQSDTDKPKKSTLTQEEIERIRRMMEGMKDVALPLRQIMAGA